MGTEGTAIFIYGEGAMDHISVTWRLKTGTALSNTESWRAEIMGEPTSSQASAGLDILDALRHKFVFKLKTDDGAIYPCGICDLDYFLDAYPSTLYFEVCSRDQRMVVFR